MITILIVFTILLIIILISDNIKYPKCYYEYFTISSQNNNISNLDLDNDFKNHIDQYNIVEFKNKKSYETQSEYYNKLKILESRFKEIKSNPKKQITKFAIVDPPPPGIKFTNSHKILRERLLNEQQTIEPFSIGGQNIDITFHNDDPHHPSFDYSNFHSYGMNIFNEDIRDQGGCGVCWAHAISGVCQTLLTSLGHNNNKKDISIQQIIDCYGNNTCELGNNILTWFYSNSEIYLGFEEINSHEKYIYNYNVNNCQSKHRNILNITNISPVNLGSNPDQNIYNYLKNHGPLTISVHGENLRDISINHDIIDEHFAIDMDTNYESQLSHAVILVGCGIENDIKYWIIRNSWGSDHGHNGYYKLRRYDDSKEQELRESNNYTEGQINQIMFRGCCGLHLEPNYIHIEYYDDPRSNYCNGKIPYYSTNNFFTDNSGCEDHDNSGMNSCNNAYGMGLVNNYNDDYHCIWDEGIFNDSCIKSNTRCT